MEFGHYDINQINIKVCEKVYILLVDSSFTLKSMIGVTLEGLVKKSRSNLVLKLYA